MILTKETLKVIKQFFTDKKAYKKTLSTYGWLIGLKHLNQNSMYRVNSKTLNNLFEMGLVSAKETKTYYTIKDLTINYYSLITNELTNYTNDEDIINNLKGTKLQGSWYISVPNWVYTNSFEGKQIEINETKKGKLTTEQQFTIMQVSYMHFNAQITDNKVSACSYTSRMFALDSEEVKDEGASLRQSINRLAKKGILIKISSMNKRGLDVVLAEKPFKGVEQLAQKTVKTDSIVNKQLDESTKQLEEAQKAIEELKKQLEEAKVQISLLTKQLEQTESTDETESPEETNVDIEPAEEELEAMINESTDETESTDDIMKQIELEKLKYRKEHKVQANINAMFPQLKNISDDEPTKEPTKEELCAWFDTVAV